MLVLAHAMRSHHPKNRTNIKYLQAVREAMAMGNMHKKFGEDRPSVF